MCSYLDMKVSLLKNVEVTMIMLAKGHHPVCAIYGRKQFKVVENDICLLKSAKVTLINVILCFFSVNHCLHLSYIKK